jgi:hypothetical protein
VRQIVVPEHLLLAAGILDTRDHRRVVQRVREDDAARQQLGQRRQGRLVRDVAGGKQQRCFLAVQIGKLRLQLDMIVTVARDVPRAARARADIVQRLFHRRDHLGMLAHGEIVVGAPHGDRLRAVMAGEAARIGISALVAQDVDEDAVASFLVQAIDRVRKDALIVQSRSSLFPCAPHSGFGDAKASANDSQ